MKKIYTISMMVVALAALIPTLVLAETIINPYSVQQEEYIEYVDVSPYNALEIESTTAGDDDLEEEIIAVAANTDDEYIKDETEILDIITPSRGKKVLKFLGKWENGTDRDFDGYWGGRITIRKTSQGKAVGVLMGLYNKTGEEGKHRIVGILKKGYFNGKLILEDGTELKITGLYRFDRENNLFKLQWMVPYHGGWAVARLSALEME